MFNNRWFLCCFHCA